MLALDAAMVASSKEAEFKFLRNNLSKKREAEAMYVCSCFIVFEAIWAVIIQGPPQVTIKLSQPRSELIKLTYERRNTFGGNGVTVR